MESGCNGFSLPLFPSYSFSSDWPSTHPELTHDWSPSGVALLWHGPLMATVPSEAPLLSHRALLSKSETPAVSPASVPFCTSPSVSPQMRPHVTPQVNSQVSVASVSSHPFLDTSKDHAAPTGCSFGALCGVSSCGQAIRN